AEAVMFSISGQNVDSEEHVSTSKAVVDAWVEEWNQVDGSPGEPYSCVHITSTRGVYAIH
ncbi:hypothetical protein AX351_RS16530, partial [Escherichia coli]